MAERPSELRSPPTAADLWACDSCRMVGSTAESEAYHVARGHEVRPLSREQAETIWDEWKGTSSSLDVKALSRRVAHAVHALMEVRNDVNIGPYGPFRACEIVLYDGEAISAQATAAALREAQKLGLALYLGRGLWTAGTLALDNCRAFEDRYHEDTSDAV